MSRPLAALYDIHGNHPALEAVIEVVRSEDVDEIVFGGDFLPGPLPTETLNCVMVVNAGSVGMPHGEAGAYWLMLDPRVELRRTLYDFEAAEAVLRQSDSPVLDIAVESIRNPKPANEMRELFTRMGLK